MVVAAPLVIPDKSTTNTLLHNVLSTIYLTLLMRAWFLSFHTLFIPEQNLMCDSQCPVLEIFE